MMANLDRQRKLRFRGVVRRFISGELERSGVFAGTEGSDSHTERTLLTIFDFLGVLVHHRYAPRAASS